MEYVDGKQLDEYIKKISGPIPDKELTTFFIQILNAIGYAHNEGLVHRDIKPSNIMIDKEISPPKIKPGYILCCKGRYQNCLGTGHLNLPPVRVRTFTPHISNI